MPRLLAFLQCEKVVIAKDDNSPNLIGIFAGVRVTSKNVPTEDEPGSLPMRWSIFTFWYREPEDEGRTYEQRVELLSPSGKALLTQESEFVMVRRRHRQIGTVFGFPLTGIGEYILRLSLRDSASGQDFQRAADFPIIIEIPQVAAAAGSPAADSPSSAKVN